MCARNGHIHISIKLVSFLCHCRNCALFDCWNCWKQECALVHSCWKCALVTSIIDVTATSHRVQKFTEIFNQYSSLHSLRSCATNCLELFTSFNFSATSQVRQNRLKISTTYDVATTLLQRRLSYFVENFDQISTSLRRRVPTENIPF